MSADSNLILYHYNASPYGQRIVYYLALRGLLYTECMQPMTIPRPDLSLLRISYRRIPLLASNSSILADTRLILSHLESTFPPSTTPDSMLSPLPNTPEARILVKTLSTSIIQGEIFVRASQLIPLNSPVWKNTTFLKDRTELSGRTWSKDLAQKNRPEALVVIRNFFSQLEDGLLADGREWLLATPKPSLADIEGSWVPAWVLGMVGPEDGNVLGKSCFPKVHAWVGRFLQLVKDRRKSLGKVERLDGIAAAKRILQQGNSEMRAVVENDEPTELKAGQEVAVWPVDSGFNHRDQGLLVQLTWDEIVIEKDVNNEAGNGSIRLHFPRTGFRVVPVKAKL